MRAGNAALLQRGDAMGISAPRRPEYIVQRVSALSSPAAPTSSIRLNRVLPFLLLTVFLDLVGFGIILPVLPLYVKTMGGSPEIVGVLFASFAFVQLLATPILGRASDRYGRRRVIVTSLAGNVASMLIFALAAHRHALVLLFASRLLAGATAGNIGACQATVADISSGAERAKGMGRLGAGIACGVMLGPFLGGLASAFGDEGAPLVAAALAFVALLGVIFFLPETNANRGTVRAKISRRASFASVVGNPRLMMVLAMYFLTFLYMSNLQVALPLLATSRLAWTPKELGYVFGLFGFVMFVVQGFLVGSLSERIAPPTLVAIGGVTSACGLGLIALAHTPLTLVGGCIVLSTGLGLTQPLLATLASNCAGGSQQGVILGLAQSSGGLARSVGPLLWGTLYGQLGPSASFVGGGIAAILASGVAVVFRASPPADSETA